MTTETTQRRLLEALADLNSTPGGIAGMLLAFPLARQMAVKSGQHELAAVWQAFADLGASVEADLKEAAHG